MFRLKYILRVILMIGFVILLSNLQILIIRYHRLPITSLTNLTLKLPFHPSTLPSTSAIIRTSKQATKIFPNRVSTTIQENIDKNPIVINERVRISPPTWIENVSIILLRSKRLFCLICIFYQEST